MGISINLKIVPFGSVSLESKGQEVVKPKELTEEPSYSQPTVTVSGIIEVDFEGQRYAPLKTTGGIEY